MNNSQLQLFVKIAETGSFTRAGQELNMTQPAVSRAISSLENELDVTLIIRDRRNGIVLTDVGQRILVIFRRILQQFDKVQQVVAAEKGLEIGTIRIGSFPMSSAHLLPKIIRSIRDRYPQIQFELHEGNILEIQEWLSSRAIDVALIIATDKEPIDTAYETLPLYSEEMLAVFRDDEPFANQEVLPVQMLDKHPMIICKGGYEVPIVDLFHRADAELHFGFVVYNVNTCLSMIEQGLGAAMLPAISLSWLPPGVKALPTEPKAYRNIEIAVPSLVDASPASRLFIETAQQLFGQG
ncbi:LysR family transcriptional regulator [Paenibacillus sp. UMB7766-LJ446]|uniref:LysR family transcriptional regulator n=1 Tax=Paenibacillus sp. UMB7766-LJ446 TaxID=3046313 RepID=UPI00254C4660|nr:LysR family transcriptional regulator [Paenibacillus sp. UMB7766-LJ446]MDK8192897.1 LysR family transcriptional regulator [Paenibacillus sp. UMB7766-LJ446]